LVVRGAALFHVVNAYTQFHYGGHGVRVDYSAISNAMREVGSRFSGARIGYPRIGAGLGRGDRSRIAAVIDDALARENHTLVVLPET
jgi:O-acetyl-ADP-ribose deacetylase (regulator of RNase III)